MMGFSEILDWILSQRARNIVARLELHTTSHTKVLDLGSGTGHNAQELRSRHQAIVTQVDVVDLHLTGEKPQLFDGRSLPFSDRSFDSSLMIYVLQYVREPEQLLREAARVSSGEITVLQTVFEQRTGRTFLNVYERFTGALPFKACQFFGLLKDVPISLNPSTQYTHRQLLQLFNVSGLQVKKVRKTALLPHLIYHYQYQLRPHE